MNSDGLGECSAVYGLPPFKIYKIGINNKSKDERYIFYSRYAYGAMNNEHIKPAIGYGWSDHFSETFPGCGRAANVVGTLGAYGNQNYDGIIKYIHSYYIILFGRSKISNWISINAIRNNGLLCSFFSLKK